MIEIKLKLKFVKAMKTSPDGNGKRPLLWTDLGMYSRTQAEQWNTVWLQNKMGEHSIHSVILPILES